MGPAGQAGWKVNCVQMKSNGTLTDDLTQAVPAACAARHLPVRMDSAATAKLLGFAEHDIQILAAVES